MKAVFWGFLSAVLLVGNVFAQEAEEGEETGLALPRMVSLRSNLINARSGPGARYPIEWVYMQKTAHKSMLSGRRSVKVTTPGENNIYDKPEYNSKVIAKVEDEVVGDVKKCPAGSDFCLVGFGNIEGWISKNNLYGIYPREVIE